MKNVRKTKIVCTMGPTTRTPDVLDALLKAGMNVARMNFSHDDHETHLKTITMVREASKRTNTPVALMLDTKGPEIRTGLVKNQGKINLVAGKKIALTSEDVECDENLISLSYKDLPKEIKAGNHVFIADGLIDLLVESVKAPRIECVVLSGGEIGSKKNVNVPGVKTKLPAITEKDEKDIRFACENGLDFIAASFIRKAQDVASIYKILEEYNSPIQVIAKIEDEEGLDNIDEIIRVSGGVMVARGDLGVQVETERIPLEQKRIISKCNAANKPVITATQMLESMVKNPRPTRAEVSDVANAILDGTDAIMLSGETANGSFPVESVLTMHKIACMAESSDEYRTKFQRAFYEMHGKLDVPSSVARAAYAMANDLDVACILTPTMSGLTARLISRWKPLQPIVAPSPNQTVLRQLLLVSGVYPIETGLAEDSDTMVQNAMRSALQADFVKRMDKVVIAAGLPLHSPLMTNAVRVYYIGNPLNQGKSGFGKTCAGRIVKADTLEDAVRTLKKEGGEILLTRSLDESFIPLLRVVEGVILEGETSLSYEMLKLTNPDLVFISGVDNAMSSFENNLTVTLSGEEKIIYEGIVE